MKCYKVTCREKNSDLEFEVGIMTSNEELAKKSAEKSLNEGRHVQAIALCAVEVSAI